MTTDGDRHGGGGGEMAMPHAPLIQQQQQQRRRQGGVTSNPLAPTAEEHAKFVATIRDGSLDESSACCHRVDVYLAKGTSRRTARIENSLSGTVHDEITRARLECEANSSHTAQPPRMQYRGKRRVVAHVMYEWHYGETIDSNTQRVSMACKDNQCINPSHVRLITMRTNNNNNNATSRGRAHHHQGRKRSADSDYCEDEHFSAAGTVVDDDRRRRLLQQQQQRMAYSPPPDALAAADDSNLSVPSSPYCYSGSPSQSSSFPASASATPSQIHDTQSSVSSMMASLRHAIMLDQMKTTMTADAAAAPPSMPAAAATTTITPVSSRKNARITVPAADLTCSSSDIESAYGSDNSMSSSSLFERG